MKRFLAASALALASASSFAQQACIASPPTTPLVGWCTPAHSPPELGDGACGDTPEHAAANYSTLFQATEPRTVLRGSCVLGQSGKAFCTIVITATGERSSLELIHGCAPGFVLTGSVCTAQDAIDDDLKVAAQGLMNQRDANGNLLRTIDAATGAVVSAELGNYDAFGRPTLVDGVPYIWPTDGTILPTTIGSANFLWVDATALSQIDTPSAISKFQYYPSGQLLTWQKSSTQGAFIASRSYNLDGKVRATASNVVITKPGTPGPTPPGTDPQPEVSVVLLPLIGSPPPANVPTVAAIIVTAGAVTLYPHREEIWDWSVDVYHRCFVSAQSSPAPIQCEHDAKNAYDTTILQVCQSVKSTAQVERRQCYENAFKGYVVQRTACEKL